MTEKRIGIIMNGVTGRMGHNQHLVRSIMAIRQQGGVRLRDGTRLMPDPILVGRNEPKLREIALSQGLERWSTDLDSALKDPNDAVYFDAQLTATRAPAVEKAIAYGKHIYCEKPLATESSIALNLARKAKAAGVKVGVVQDKLFLPGLRKLSRLIDSGFFGRLLSVRGEFGYWVFEGDWGIPPQRPSWNYRKEDGGGIIMDMFCHWRYVIDHTFGPIKSVSCTGATQIHKRIDEQGLDYTCTADDTAFGTFELESGVLVQINSSWNFRVYRDELFSMQVDGTLGSAVAGLRECKVQPRAVTPLAVWNPDAPNPLAFRNHWEDVPDNVHFDNGFKVQWELFLKHIAEDAPFPHDFLEGARGIQLAELAIDSWKQRCWVDVPALEV